MRSVAGWVGVWGGLGRLGGQAYGAIPAQEPAGFDFTDPAADLIAAERDRLQAAGADVIIGVSHSGFLLDVSDQEVGWPLPLVVSGHCHSARYHWASDGRQVVKARETGRGLLRLHLDPGGERHQFAVETFPASVEPAAQDGLEEVHL